MKRAKFLTAVILVFAMFICMLPVCAAESKAVNEVIFDDAYGSGYYTNGWGNYSISPSSAAAKNGKNALKFSISRGGGNMCAILMNSVPVDVSADDLSDVVLKMWIRLPEDEPLPIFILYTKDDVGMMQSVLPLKFYVDKNERGKWKRLQIPLSEITKNGRYDNGSYGKTNFKQFVGIAFKCNADGLSKNFEAYFDDIIITSDFSKSENTYKLKSIGGEAITPEPKVKGGKEIYAELFSDSAAGSKASGCTFGYDRRYKTEGVASARITAAAQSAASAEISLKNPIYLPKETLEKSALYFDVRADDASGLRFMLITHNKDAHSLTSYIPLKEYPISKNGWCTVSIPYENLPLSGTVWLDEAEVYTEKAVDWTKIAGFGIYDDNSARSESNAVYIDNVYFGEKTEDIKTEASVKKLSEEEFKNYPQNFSCVDISKQANRDFRDETAYDGEGGWIDQGIEDLRGFKLKGINEFKGVPFNIIDPAENNDKGLIVMQGQNRKGFEKTVTVPVDKEAKGIYFLHSAAWIDSEYAGEYIIEYSDGARLSVPLTKNAEIADWQTEIKSETAETAYMCWNENGQNGGFAIFAWKNKYPEKKIKNIIIKTPGDKAFIMLAGITLSDNAPAFITTAEEKKIYPKEEINPDTSSGWFPVTALADTKLLMGSPLDVSWALDAPAGKHGYITRQGEDFVFEDGTKVRFWGCDVVANCVFLPKEKIDDLVRQISASGYNLVRFHHMDADWIERNIFGLRGARNSTRTIDAESLDRFEYFWSELKKLGIYIMVDPSCDRRLAATDLGPECAGWAFKSAAVVDERLQELQKEYATALFSHVNPYTGTSLKDDPILALVDIINEDSLFWTNAIFWGMQSGYRKDILDEDFTKWLKEKYKTTEALKEAWTEEGKSGLPENETLESKVTVPVYYNLAGNVSLSKERLTDTRYFISVFMQRYYEKMLDFYRNELKIKAMICGSNAPTFPEICDLYSQSACGADFIDQHYYFGGESTHYFSNGMTVYNLADSMLADGGASIIDIMQNRKVVNMPYVISEWNMVEPLLYSAEGAPIMSAYSGLLNLSPIVFAFAQDYVEDAYMGVAFDTREVPTKAALSYVSGLMAIRGDVSESQTGYYETVSRSAASSTIDYKLDIPTAVKRIAKTGVCLTDNEDQTGDISKSNAALKDYAEKMLKETGKLTSVTGELRTDMENETFEINTERTQGYIGKIGGKKGVLNNADICAENKFAVITLTSLSESSIENAAKLLLSAVGRWRNTDMRFSDDGNKMLLTGDTPMLCEQITGYVDIKTSGNYEVWCLDQSGQRTKAAKTEKQENGATRIYLENGDNALNYEIVKIGDSEKAEFEKPNWYNEPLKEEYFGASDANDAPWAKNVINSMLYKEVIKTDNGKFYPNSNASGAEINEWTKKLAGVSLLSSNEAKAVEREKFFLEIARLLQNNKMLDYKGAKAAEFADYDDICGELREYLSPLCEMKIMGGDENNMLNPKRFITKAEALTVIGKLPSGIKNGK